MRAAWSARAPGHPGEILANFESAQVGGGGAIQFSALRFLKKAAGPSDPARDAACGAAARAASVAFWVEIEDVVRVAAAATT